MEIEFKWKGDAELFMVDGRSVDIYACEPDGTQIFLLEPGAYFLYDRKLEKWFLVVIAYEYELVKAEEPPEWMKSRVK